MKIAVISYYGLTALIEQLGFIPPSDVQIEIYEGILEDALAAARDLEDRQSVDIFISGGGNYHLLSNNLKTPTVEIKVTGFDFLAALKKAHQISDKVALLTYQRKIPYLEEIAPVLKPAIVHRTFNSVKQLDRLLGELSAEGCNAFIGGSLLIQKAKDRGLPNFFIYSQDSVLNALENAVKIALAQKREMEKAQEVRTILDFVSEGVIATDQRGVITVFNPSAEKITGLLRERVVGRKADKVIPGTRLSAVLQSRQPELNHIQLIGDVKILTNRIPIITKGNVTGSVATFKDFGAVQEAEARVRQKLLQKGFVAKTKLGDIIGSSLSFLTVKTKAAHYAKSSAAILILGESGTGKELFAQAIHNESARANKPFVAVNCAALPENLLESELFGYDEGAFTGAKKGGKPGLFELAHGGTIFLDEIGEMSFPIQARLLRVLEEREVLRIGGDRLLPVDIRILAATNRNIWKMVKEGRFREDLYYRLCVLEVFLPPLISRKDDIPALLRKFLSNYNIEFPANDLETLCAHPFFKAYPWPGNVRELKNIAERISVLYKPGCAIDELITSLTPRNKLLSEEQDRLIEVLAEAEGNRADAAKRLGISRTTLWRKLRKLR
ncbi:MAG TPA: sigma 54-interacting transcriptional regulator [Selenomonadales bacterium]|nr:sigma 54-interacting transcriptional regulator [Selenomonadales bacterium]